MTESDVSQVSFPLGPFRLSLLKTVRDNDDRVDSLASTFVSNTGDKRGRYYYDS